NTLVSSTTSPGPVVITAVWTPGGSLRKHPATATGVAVLRCARADACSQLLAAQATDSTWAAALSSDAPTLGDRLRGIACACLSATRRACCPPAGPSCPECRDRVCVGMRPGLWPAAAPRRRSVAGGPRQCGGRARRALRGSPPRRRRPRAHRCAEPVLNRWGPRRPTPARHLV